MSARIGIADAVDAAEIWNDLAVVASFGGRADGGVGRLALDDNDIAVRLWLADQAKALNCSVRVDPLGNLFIRREGTVPALHPVATGSHIDTQPAGGRYDGIYGVIAGLNVLRALSRTAVEHRRALELVAWTNEEGVRFSPGTSGSSGFTGERNAEEVRAILGTDGVTFGDAVDHCLTQLEAAGIPRCELGGPMQAFVELHIEQGPILENLEADVGVVTGIQGVSWFRFTVRGMANHAGTTPRASRRDAFEGAAALATALRNVAMDELDVTRFTIGRFNLSPDSINTIPDTAIFTVDLRNPDSRVLDEIEQRFGELATSSWSGCSVHMERLSRIDPVEFPDAITSIIASVAQQLDLKAPTVVSGAFHDSMYLSRHCPTGMIFIPCKAGVSHHPSESITADQALTGTRLLAETLLELAS